MSKRRSWRIGVLGLVLLASLTGCGPEGSRQRGDGLGSGADIGNYSAEFRPKSKIFPGEGAP